MLARRVEEQNQRVKTSLAFVGKITRFAVAAARVTLALSTAGDGEGEGEECTLFALPLDL